MFTARQFVFGIVAGAIVGSVVTAVFFSLGDSSADRGTDDTPVVTLPARGEGDTARARTLRLADPAISFRELKRLGEAMAMDDPVSAIEEGMKIPGTDNRETFLESIFRTWGEVDGVTAASWADENLLGARRSDALYYIADGWAESDPAGAGTWFQENTGGVIFEDAAWEILESWGRKDAAAAFRWSDSLEPFEKDAVMDALAEGWAAVDAVAARDAGMKMLEEREPYAIEFLVSVATQWGGSDPEAAAKWGQSLLFEPVRDGVLRELGEIWGMADAAAAARWVGTIEDPGDRRFAESGLALGWSEHDPAAAMEWILELPGEERHVDSLVDDVVYNWIVRDPRGAVKWLQEAPRGPGRDSVLESFSDNVMTDNPEAAVAWALEISDPELRRTHARDLAETWIALDGEAAIRKLREMDLPENFGPLE